MATPLARPLAVPRARPAAALTGPALVVGALTAAGALGAIVVLFPPAIVLPLAAAGGIVLLASPGLRLAFVVFGGLAAFQSSAGLSVVKFGYLVGVVAVLGAAVLAWDRRRGLTSYVLVRPVVRQGLLFLGVVLGSVVVSLARGTPLADWFRDVVPNVLVAAVPILALDAQGAGAAEGPTRLLERLFVAAGTIAAVGVAVGWLDRRGLADLPFDQAILPTNWLPAALFYYAIGRALAEPRGQLRWLALGGGVFVLLLATGSRSNLIYLAGLVPLALAGATDLGGRLRRLGGYALAGTLLALLGLQALTASGAIDVSGWAERFRTIPAVLADPTGDGSFVERAEQTTMAWQTFLASPLFGTGPGHVYEYRRVSGEIELYRGYAIDTALAFPAKFGLIGVALVLLAAWAYVRLAGDLRRFPQAAAARGALIAWGMVSLLTLPLTVPWEDKGYSFGLLFLLALCLAGADRAAPQPSGASPR
jgi:hypothetical protein